MEHIRKYAIGYILLALVIGIAIAQLPWTEWFSKTDEAQEPVLDANGKPTGRFVPRVNGTTSRARSCCAVGNIGFIGNCNYPIGAGVPPCGNA